jgi:hypothetical protein
VQRSSAHLQDPVGQDRVCKRSRMSGIGLTSAGSADGAHAPFPFPACSSPRQQETPI